MLKEINHKEIENLCIKCRKELSKNGKKCPFLYFVDGPCPELVLADKVFDTLNMTIAKKYEELKKGREV